jgi:hypothetical protein
LQEDAIPVLKQPGPVEAVLGPFADLLTEAGLEFMPAHARESRPDFANRWGHGLIVSLCGA